MTLQVCISSLDFSLDHDPLLTGCISQNGCHVANSNAMYLKYLLTWPQIEKRHWSWSWNCMFWVLAFSPTVSLASFLISEPQFHHFHRLQERYEVPFMAVDEKSDKRNLERVEEEDGISAWKACGELQESTSPLFMGTMWFDLSIYVGRAYFDFWPLVEKKTKTRTPFLFLSSALSFITYLLSCNLVPASALVSVTSASWCVSNSP